MTATADILVIGAGVHGASTAWHLARAGAGKVVLLDKAGIACGPTAKSGALIRPIFTHGPYIQLVTESLEMFESWDNAVGGDAGWVGRGFLRITPTLEAAHIGGDLHLMRQLGVAYEIIGPEQLTKLVPHGTYASDEHGLWIARAGYADPVRTTRALAHAAEREGVEIMLGVAVTGIHCSSSRIMAVETSAGLIHTRTVLNCAGPWAPRLSAMVGVSLPIETHRTPTCLFQRAPTMSPGGPVLSDGTHRVYLRDVGETLVRAAHFGWTADPVDPDDYDETIRPGQLHDIRTGIEARYQSYQHNVFAGGFSAIYDMTPDGHPIIGRVGEIEGFWCNCGWSGNGFASAPALGRHLAAQMLGIESEVDLSLFRWPRSSKVKARPDHAWVYR